MATLSQNPYSLVRQAAGCAYDGADKPNVLLFGSSSDEFSRHLRGFPEARGLLRSEIGAPAAGRGLEKELPLSVSKSSFLSPPRQKQVSKVLSLWYASLPDGSDTLKSDEPAAGKC